MAAINWIPLLNNTLRFEVDAYVYPTKGNLVYEYNPFRNYRLSRTMFEYKGEYYTQEELEDKFGITCKMENDVPVGWEKGDKDITKDVILHERGELVDFITDELSFSIKSPVTIVPQYSYDGSVNLIINDGVNVPRMINSRFSATGRNTYEVVDRKGNNDTNIYDLGEQFEIDTSLYKRVIKIPKIKFNGVTSGGNLRVGNYHFYFKLSDADGNETDFVGETGLVSVFIGFNDPKSVTTGVANENSFKSVKLLLSNVDTAYNYVYVYYSRYTAADQEEFNTEYIKIDKKFVINNAGVSDILVTGFEDLIPISAADINLNYNIVDAAYALTSCQNMLFLGNVHKPDIPYEELADLSLRFLPYLKQETYPVDMDLEYRITTSSKGYYDPKFIYEKTGYWGEEIYRFGIVYIMPNNELTPVFNIRGGNLVLEYMETNMQYSNYPLYEQLNGLNVRVKVSYDDSNYQVLPNGSARSVMLENVKGVVRFIPTKDTNTIYGVEIRVKDDVIEELRKYVKGYFFVRQTRIPTILCLGVTIGIDLNAYTPCVATADGYLTLLASQLSYSHVCTEDINDINYISEGFLSRYSFKFTKKSSGFWGSILGAIGIVVGVAALAVATVVTCGAAGAVAGAVAAGVGTAATAAGVGAGVVAAVTAIPWATVGIVTAAAVVGTAATMATLGVIDEVRYAVSRAFTKIKLDGRNTECPDGYNMEETENSRKLTQEYYDRIIIKDPSKVKVQGILCPDYEVNQAYYNSIFTGNKHTIGLTITQCTNGLVGHSSNYFTNDYRHFYIPSYYDMGIRNTYDFKIIGVPDDVTLTGIDDMKFRSRAGNAEEAWRYECIGDDYKTTYSKLHDLEDEQTISNKQINTDIIRGSFGPYLAFNDKNNKFSPAETVNIYIPEFSVANMDKYFEIRMQDNTPFSAISDRYDINHMDDYLVTPINSIIVDPQATIVAKQGGYHYTLYRGDCYLCQFTHRMHRNFQDPGAPFNDEIVQEKTWKENYITDEPEKYNQINLGDVNAVKIGSWVTFRVRSSFNLNIRTLDRSNIAETAMAGHPYGYYPYNDMEVEGTYKHPESQIYNKGFSKSLSERFNMELPDVPHIKNWFKTRIMYSDIHINDAYKNGYRVFRSTAYRDYTREYGEIVKLISLESDLICIFEHGVARIPVNKAAVAQHVAAGANQLITSNVLPEAPIILSDMFGSQWADSVIKTPGKAGNSKLYIYGVDTIAKKIWRTDGQSLECISDMRVQEFLNNNITLGERENTPILGVRNVKTFYNAFKRDVMFTFYDDTYGFEEKAWNLCWSELLEKFITFYSWVPSMMENINNIPFSFDRNVSKWIAKLGTSHANNSFSDGITLTNNVINNYFLSSDVTTVVDDFSYDFTYRTVSGEMHTERRIVPTAQREGFIGVLNVENRILPDDTVFYTINYELEKDPWGNYKNFEIRKIEDINLALFTNPAPMFTLTLVDHDGGSGDDGQAVAGDLTFPIYGLYFNQSAKSQDELLVYMKPRADEANAVYAYAPRGQQDESGRRGSRVMIKGPTVDPETLMSELYYRNVAGHAYADYDANKIKFGVDNTYVKPVDALDPNTLYNIEQIMEYVAKNWYGNEDDILPSETEDKEDNKRGESLLERSGGPFSYDTIVYLWNFRTVNGKTELYYYACSGGLGNLIDHPERHVPFTSHYMYGAYIEQVVGTRREIEELPIFKDITGKRLMLPREEQTRPDLIVSLLNIRANISILDAHQLNLSDTYYNHKASYNRNTTLINAAQYESIIGVTTKWNLQFLTSDFWKHGQAANFDIADDIFPTNWYGKQHPFEFECVVVDDPSIHKIFTNLELIANKAKPESFHYEVVGETYDFAKDKVNMYFRQEALKALWLYNGEDIAYDRNFLKVQPRQQPRSADFVHRYYTRLDTINDIEDYYIHITYPNGYDYRHLSGAEIVYYPTRQEFRIWNHAIAVDLKNLSQDDARSIIAGNCEYLEDRWKVTINPILVCYKNEYSKAIEDGYPLIHPLHTTWAQAYESSQLLPPLPINNSPIPNKVKESGQIKFPGIKFEPSINAETNLDRSNALYHLYDLTKFGITTYSPLDTKSWLDDESIYGYRFGYDHNRKEVDVRDKFMKVRIRYSGDELAIIDFLNTIYQVSYA